MRRLNPEELGMEVGKHYFSINSAYYEFYFKYIREIERTDTEIVQEVYIYYALTNKYDYRQDPKYAGGKTKNKIRRNCRHIIFELTDDEVRDLILLETI